VDVNCEKNSTKRMARVYIPAVYEDNQELETPTTFHLPE